MMKRTAPLLAGLLFVSTAFAQDAAAVAPVPPVEGPASLLSLVKTGGWVMIPLGLASVITLTLILVYLVSLRRNTIVTGQFMETAEALLKKRDHRGLLAVSTRHNEAIARIAGRMLDFATKTPGATLQGVREVAETEGSRIAGNLNQRIVYLADVAMLAPMLGLLGTVTGIIKSFGTLGAKAADASRTLLLAKGVGEALVTTASGLIVGIVAMAFYALFRGRVQSLIAELEGATAHLMSLFSASFEKTPREAARRSVIDDDDF
ncbi:MAG TPA: MotA/TolQ/ExbB proton channel family protein [Chthoniobacterales bacterium]